MGLLGRRQLDSRLVAVSAGLVPDAGGGSLPRPGVQAMVDELARPSRRAWPATKSVSRKPFVVAFILRLRNSSAKRLRARRGEELNGLGLDGRLVRGKVQANDAHLTLDGHRDGGVLPLGAGGKIEIDGLASLGEVGLILRDPLHLARSADRTAGADCSVTDRRPSPGRCPGTAPGPRLQRAVRRRPSVACRTSAPGPPSGRRRAARGLARPRGAAGIRDSIRVERAGIFDEGVDQRVEYLDLVRHLGW